MKFRMDINVNVLDIIEGQTVKRMIAIDATFAQCVSKANVNAVTVTVETVTNAPKSKNVVVVVNMLPVKSTSVFAIWVLLEMACLASLSDALIVLQTLSAFTEYVFVYLDLSLMATTVQLQAKHVQALVVSHPHVSHLVPPLVAHHHRHHHHHQYHVHLLANISVLVNVHLNAVIHGILWDNKKYKRLHINI